MLPPISLRKFASVYIPSPPQLISERLRSAILVDLGWRLQHCIAARDHNPDQVAERVGITSDDFALALSGHQDLPFSTVSLVLDVLDVEWWQLFGADMRHAPRVHDVTLDSDAWHAIQDGLQPFDLRRDVERYRVGDWLRLHEKLGRHRTGRVLTMEVTYIFYLASVGLPPGYVALALRPIKTVQLA
jgi:hypothetical protein